MKIDLVIPIFNRPDYTEVCLASMVEADHGIAMRPVILDNGSRMPTQKIIAEYAYKWDSKAEFKASVCREQSNLGFAGALSSYLKSPRFERLDRPDAVIFMHNDVVMFNGWAKELVSVYEELVKSDELAVVMPKTNYANESSMCDIEVRKVFEAIKPSNKDRLLPDEISSIIKKTYDGFGGVDAYLEKASKSDPSCSYCPEISSFCMMIKADLFGKYGHFDADFFPRGYEDKFWFLKPERDGMCCYVANRSYVHHFGNITSDGPGFCQPDIMKLNAARYKDKVRKADEGKIHEEGEE